MIHTDKHIKAIETQRRKKMKPERDDEQVYEEKDHREYNEGRIEKRKKRKKERGKRKEKKQPLNY